MKVILIRPMYDKVTKTLGSWTKDILVRLDLASDLTGQRAIEQNLRESLKKDASIICFYGHGEPAYLIGHGVGNEPNSRMIHVQAPGVQPPELAKLRLYAVACHAGAILGPSLAKAGCIFVGYNQQFGFPGGNFEADFAEIVNATLLQWINEPGSSGTEIAAQLKERWFSLKREASLGSKRHLKNSFLAALLANWNYDSACCHE